MVYSKKKTEMVFTAKEAIIIVKTDDYNKGCKRHKQEGYCTNVWLVEVTIANLLSI